MSKWRALWKTIRPLNLLIMALTMLGVYGAIIALLGEGLENNHWLFGLLIISIVLLGAGGNIINDIEDVDVDSVNKPGVNQIGLAITKSWAINWYAILTLGGLLSGLIVAAIQVNLILFLTILFIASSLWFYSRWMQKQVLMGNFVIAVLCALLPVLAWLFSYGEIEISTLQKEPGFKRGLEQGISQFGADLVAVPYVFLAFALTFVRELSKDIQDIVGDKKNDYNTFPVAFGFANSKKLTVFLLVLIIILELMLSYVLISEQESVLISVVILIFILIPIFISTYFGFKMKTSKDAGKLSSWLKITMALGIATTAFFWFL